MKAIINDVMEHPDIQNKYPVLIASEHQEQFTKSGNLFQSILSALHLMPIQETLKSVKQKTKVGGNNTLLTI